jgi:hypothetical protein
VSTEIPFAYAETDADVEDRRPWLEDRRERERLLGVGPPRAIIPDYPDVLVVPGHRKDYVAPQHFRAYCRLGLDVLCDVGETFERARWNLQRFVEGRA